MKKAIFRLVVFCLITAIAFTALVMPASAFEWDNAGAINRYDYILIASHYFGTYKIG